MVENMNEHELCEFGEKIRLIVSDMDGTLLNANKQVSVKNIEVLRSLKARGVEFTICTGRIATMVGYYSKILEISKPMITANGAVIWDPLKKKVLFEKTVPLDAALELIRFCRLKQLDCSALTLEACYFTKNSKRRMRFVDYNAIACSIGDEVIPLEIFDENLSCIRDKKIHKILVYAFNDREYQEAITFLDSLSEIEFTSSDKNLLDISAQGVSKGSGVSELIKRGGFRKEETCIFGDYYNDISMVKAAGISFAMKNGCDAMKKAATAITDTNDDDGVAKAIEKYILKK